MNKLEELYIARKVLQSFNQPISPELKKQIENLELTALEEINEVVEEQLPINLDFTCLKHFVIGAEYVDGKPVAVGSTTELNLRDNFWCVHEINDQEAQESDDSTGGEEFGKQDVCCKGGASIVFSVKSDDGKEIPKPQPTEKAKGKRTKFSLNGGEPAGKNRTVWNAVRNLLKELPTATFKEISDFFPKSLQGSYGVVATVEDIEERSKRNQTENGRWFLNSSDILTSADGIRFAVSTEWGYNFDNFRAHIIREFGWIITEV